MSFCGIGAWGARVPALNAAPQDGLWVLHEYRHVRASCKALRPSACRVEIFRSASLDAAQTPINDRFPTILKCALKNPYFRSLCGGASV
jgi:hypothetical protein